MHHQFKKILAKTQALYTQYCSNT